MPSLYMGSLTLMDAVQLELRDNLIRLTEEGKISWKKSERREPRGVTITWYEASWGRDKLELEDFFDGTWRRARLRIDHPDGTKSGMRDGLESHPLDTLVQAAERSARQRATVEMFLP